MCLDIFKDMYKCFSIDLPLLRMVHTWLKATKVSFSQDLIFTCLQYKARFERRTFYVQKLLRIIAH